MNTEGLTVVAESSGRNDAPKWTEKWQVYLAGAALLVTGAGLLGVFFQLRTTREQGLADRTAQLVERYQRHEYIELWSRAGYGFLKASSAGDCLDRIRCWEQAPHAGSELQVRHDAERPPARLSEVQYAVNFHEEIAVLFNTKRIDQDQLMRHFAAAVVSSFDLAWWWVHWRRDNRLAAADPAKPRDHESTRYAEWQLMVNTIMGDRPELSREPATDVWILCTPENPSKASAQSWAEHRDVSLALTRPLEEVVGLEDDVRRALGETPSKVEHHRVVCVPPWQATHEHERIRRLSTDLSSLFERDGLAGLSKL